MLLGGRAMRRLYSLAVRPYSVAVEASGAATAEGAASTVDRETDGDTSDVTTRNLSFKDMNRSRTRAKVEAQMWGFLRSRAGPANELWTQGPPREAYWLLRACGSDMIMETAKTRMDLTQTMWEEFQKRAPLPVGMYNTLLQVYQQNSHRFDPAQFLEGMEQDGVLPNQGTLVGMLACYCEVGDMEGAMKMLSQMKSLDMAINENIYAALITGHCRHGDMESAEGMLAVMEENGMSPTATSYTALVCGHADRGDMDRVEKLLEEMRQKRVFPSVSVFTAIIDRLSLSGHSDLLTRALDLVPDKQLISYELYDVACKSTVRGDSQGTLIILRCLATLSSKSNAREPLFPNLGAVLVRTMAAQGWSLPEITVMAAELQSLGFRHHVNEEILHFLLTRQDKRDEAMQEALTVLQDMHHHDAVVKELYFYPIMAYYAQKGDMDGAVKCALVMKDIGLSLKKVTFRFLLQTSRQMGVASSEGNDKEGVVSSEGSDEEGVVSSDESDEEGVASSKGNEKVGVASSKGRHVIEDVNRLLAHVEGTPLSLSLVNEVIVHLLERGQFGEVPTLLMSAEPTALRIGLILKGIKNGLAQSKVMDMEGLVGIYAALKSLPACTDLKRSISYTTMGLADESPSMAKHFIEELSKNDIDVGDAAYDVLLRSFATPDTVGEFHSMVKQLQSQGVVLPLTVHKQTLRLAADTGDPIRAGQAVSAIRRSGEQLSSTAYSRYIIANAKSRRIGTALELYEKMRGHSLRPSYLAMSELTTELLRWGDLHGAENLRRDLEEMGYSPGLALMNAFIGAYARRDMTRAMQEFESLKASRSPTQTTYKEIMVGYSIHGDTDSIRELMKELQGKGLSLDRSLTSRLFDAYLTNGDIDGALAVVSEFPAHPPHASSLTQALQLAVDSENETHIKQVSEHMRQISGAASAATALFCAYVRTNNMDRANQTLQDEEFSLNLNMMVAVVLELSKRRKREEIYSALELLRSKGHHYNAEGAVVWLRMYDILGDVEAAMALERDLVAANISLTNEFKGRLATMLERRGYSSTARDSA